MHLSVTLTVTVPLLVLLLNSVQVRSAPQWSQTTPAPQLGFKGYLAEFQRINDEVTAAVIRGDTEKVQQLSRRLSELRQQSEREARESEERRRRAQEEQNRRDREERDRRTREKKAREKSDSGPTAVYVIVAILILIGVCIGMVKMCNSGGSGTTTQPTYGRPAPAPVTNTFNTQTTAGGGFTLRPNEYTFTGASQLPVARSGSASPRARTPSPRHTPTPTRRGDERSPFAPSAPLLNPNNEVNDAPPAYEEAIRSSPRPVRAQSTEEGPPPFNSEFNSSNA